ncbi:hypothetical protein AC244_10095 [Ensifer adhaerens]|uniref:Uncharacterized protein n=1 Tax=Ensifer adhaerens TaxID=106592 RepID=A0A0L8C072_ENSAD|nr:hypothetical protein [Ensifer adhaerens]KOF20210.1 hypothetical protein AC244_10095 [Ensifer adhaerens]
MVFTKAIARSVVALSLAVVPAAGGMVGAAGTAFAKDGHGNSGGGGGNGNGGSHGGGSGSSNGKSETARANKDSRSSKASDKSTLKSFFTRDKAPDTAKKSAKADKLAKVDPVGAGAGTPGLRSLNRNYHAYINSNDPRMAAVSAYAIAYAEFEAENGVDAIPSDPTLSDEALRDALAGFSKDGVVTDDMLDEAKDILGVGPEVGKIDQIRDTLPPPTVE